MKVKYVPHKDFDEDGEPIIEQAIEREVRLADKLKALELCGKHLGMFADKVKLDGTVPVIIVGDED